MDPLISLNASAAALCQSLETRAAQLRIAQHTIGGARVWDFGIDVPGGLEAGLTLARICLADLGDTGLERGHQGLGVGAALTVRTDFPVLACLGAQYAGWQLKTEGYFAMGSGPMRVLAGKEPMISELGLSQQSDIAVGVLESSALPGSEICREVAESCGVAPERLILCVAPTSSLAGSMQIVARSVETTLHKMHELRFDLQTVYAGWGTAPLPPATRSDLVALGWTNDAILYGGRVVLWVDSDDQWLREVVPRVPSSASRDYGRPFAEVYREYGGDFYQIVPLLFSPAMVTVINRSSGRSFEAGRMADDVLRRSFQIS